MCTVIVSRHGFIGLPGVTINQSGRASTEFGGPMFAFPSSISISVQDCALTLACFRMSALVSGGHLNHESW
jgi:hypothetical protein